VAALWWLKREARRLAQQGDYAQAYEVLDALVPDAEPKLVEELADQTAYSEVLEQDVIKLEHKVEALEAALKSCREEREGLLWRSGR
jgi:hypothetical protein